MLGGKDYEKERKPERQCRVGCCFMQGGQGRLLWWGDIGTNCWSKWIGSHMQICRKKLPSQGNGQNKGSRAETCLVCSGNLKEEEQWVRDEVQDEVRNIVGDRVAGGCVGHCEDFGFYLEWTEILLAVFKQRSELIWQILTRSLCLIYGRQTSEQGISGEGEKLGGCSSSPGQRWWWPGL